MFKNPWSPTIGEELDCEFFVLVRISKNPILSIALALSTGERGIPAHV